MVDRRVILKRIAPRAKIVITLVLIVLKQDDKEKDVDMDEDTSVDVDVDAYTITTQGSNKTSCSLGNCMKSVLKNMTQPTLEKCQQTT
jgi:3-isopropylmalate dehydratase small subunit